MSSICQNCEKAVTIGNSQRHGRGVAGKRWKKRAPDTRRLFKPNLQKIAVVVDGKKVHTTLCAKCIKRLNKDGKLSPMTASKVAIS